MAKKATRTPLSGRVFALSATGVRQRELEDIIKQNGGVISRTMHHRVDFLVATPLAIERNTQHIRKAATKFPHIVLVRPEFVHESVAVGSLCDADKYSPREPAANADSTGSGSSSDLGSLVGGSDQAADRSCPATAMPLPNDGDSVEVLVEMSDEPTMQWWPVRLVGSAASAGLPAHSIVYQPLPKRGYETETPSRARFKAAAAAAASEPQGDGKMYDLDEGTWRQWRWSASVAPPPPPLPASAASAPFAAAVPSPANGCETTGSHVSEGKEAILEDAASDDACWAQQALDFAPPRSRCKVPTSSGSTAVMAAAGSVARQPLRGIGASVGQMRFSSRRVQVELSFGAARRGVSYDDHPMISRFGSIVEKHVETSFRTVRVRTHVICQRLEITSRPRSRSGTMIM